MGDVMIEWFVKRSAPIRRSPSSCRLALGYYFGSFNYKGLGLGAVTATLIAAVIIGQLDITITGPAQAVLLPDVPVRHRLWRSGRNSCAASPRTAFRRRCLPWWSACSAWSRAYLAAKLAGYDVGSAAGLYAGSQTISASMGLATDAINRLGLSPEETKKLLDAMPVAYAVTYIFGTVGSAIVIALLGPVLLGINLEAACKRYEEKHGGKKEMGGPGTAWHQFELRAFRVKEGGLAVGKTAQEAEALLPEQRVFIQRIRRGGQIMDATADR